MKNFFGIIYKATNLKNKKVYIGCTTKKLEHRIRQHKNLARSNSRFKFHRALRKYGDDIKFEELCSVLGNERDLSIVEQYFIDFYNSINAGYNLVPSRYSENNSQHISNTMKKEWKENREARQKINSISAHKRWSTPGEKERMSRITKQNNKESEISIVAVSINSGAVKFYECVNDAIREGYSSSSIYNSLNQKCIKGQKNIWFYKKDENPDWYKNEAKKRLGTDFNTDFNRPIIRTNLLTLESKKFLTIYEASEEGFKTKEISRVLKGQRGSCRSFTWKFDI